MPIILYFTSVSLSSVSFIFAGVFLLGDRFGSLVGAGWTCSELIAHHVPYTFTAWDHRCSGIEGWKLFSYVSWVCSRGDAVLRTEPAVQVDFATYGLILKQSFKEMFKVMFSDIFVQHLYNILQPLIGIFLKIWWYFTTFRCLRWSFSRPWTRVFLSSIVLELQAAHGCASEHKQFAFGSMWDFEILSFKRTIWNSEMTFNFYMFFNESMSFLSMLSRPGWVSKVNDSESQSRRRWPCWAHVARLC